MDQSAKLLPTAAKRQATRKQHYMYSMMLPRPVQLDHLEHLEHLDHLGDRQPLTGALTSAGV